MKFILSFLLVTAACMAQPDSLAVHREKLNAAFANPEISPLLASDLAAFTQLDFYPYSERFNVRAKLTRSKDAKAFEMKTTTGRLPLYREFGTLDFEIDGKPLQLKVYQNMELATRPGYKNYLFLPFLDLTSGKDTYVGGRYLDLQIPPGDEIRVDFNRAYNPYCAYNYEYSCPLVPPGNDLPVAIMAGEKKFHE